MKSVTVYTTNHCPYCTRVKNLLKSKNIPFQEIDLTNNSAKREALEAQTGWMTVPMVFIGDKFIGGSDSLDELSRSGELSKLLQ